MPRRLLSLVSVALGLRILIWPAHAEDAPPTPAPAPALAGANPRDGANGDDGISTALEASYLDLEEVDLVTRSA